MYKDKEGQFGMMSTKFLYLDSHNNPIRCESFELQGRIAWFEHNFHKQKAKPKVQIFREQVSRGIIQERFLLINLRCILNNVHISCKKIVFKNETFSYNLLLITCQACQDILTDLQYYGNIILRLNISKAKILKIYLKIV